MVMSLHMYYYVNMHTYNTNDDGNFLSVFHGIPTKVVIEILTMAYLSSTFKFEMLFWCIYFYLFY